MNYRHAYHAGNFADVMKHALLVWIVGYLRQKTKPLFFLDTHAGRGSYRLDADEAARTGEWRDGIGRLIGASDAPDEIRPYLDLVARDLPRSYPGSPVLIERLLRANDRLFACELHPEDFKSLEAVLPRRHVRIRLFHQDGYGALNALPPAEKRGMVLIDPPYEARDEFDRVVAALKRLYRQFATCTAAVWYPIKAGWGTEAFHAELTQTGIKRIVAAELRVRREDGEKLAGSGLVVVNPPFGFEQSAGKILDWLAKGLGQDKSAQSRVVTLVGE